MVQMKQEINGANADEKMEKPRDPTQIKMIRFRFRASKWNKQRIRNKKNHDNLEPKGQDTLLIKDKPTST